MFTSNLERIAPIIVLVILIGCGGGGGGLPDPGLSNVKVETRSARAAVITSEGGAITATGSNGVVYTLTVPEGAVVADTRISMYPISSLANMPGGGKTIAGVHFMPEGLQLYASAKLTMQLPAGIDPKQIAGLAYKGNSEELRLDMAFAQGQTVTMFVQHFSGKALGNRQVADLLHDPGTTFKTAVFQTAMETADLAARQQNTDPTLSFRNTLNDWYHQVVEPAFQKSMAVSSTDFSAQRWLDLLLAHVEYDAWLDAILFANIETQAITNTPFIDPQPELNDSEALAVSYLLHYYHVWDNRSGVYRNNQIDGLILSDPIEDASEAMMAGIWAQDWQIPLQPNHLDDEYLLNNLTVKAVIRQKQFVSGSQPGDAVALQVKAGVTIGSPLIPGADNARFDIPLRVKFSRGANTIQTITTDSQGMATCTTTWPQGVNPLKIDILATIKRASGRDRPRISVFDVATKTSGPGSLVIVPSTADIDKGQTITLTARRLDSNGNELPLDPSLVAWSISPLNVANLVSNGLTATVTGLTSGTAAVAVAATVGGLSLSATADIHVKSSFLDREYVGTMINTLPDGTQQTLTNTHVKFYTNPVGGPHLAMEVGVNGDFLVGFGANICSHTTNSFVADLGTGPPCVFTFDGAVDDANHVSTMTWSLTIPSFGLFARSFTGTANF
jgi:hypothetical protein